MQGLHPSPQNLSRQPWFLLVLALYTLLELSFNHRLLELAGGLQSDTSPESWRHLEVWARLLSGLGLSLLLMRWLAPRVRSRLGLVLGCGACGLLLMWHVQKTLVDVIVARADESDLRMSVQAHLSTSEALQGRLQLRGLPVLDAPVQPSLRPLMRALWPSSVLGLEPDDLEPMGGAAQLASQWLPTPVSMEHMRDAYRKAVVTPVALGASLAFGLMNLCQLLGGISAMLWRRWAPAARSGPGLERRLWWAWFVLGLGWSLGSSHPWAASPGYTEVARPALWSNQPLLAPFVEWSLRAEPAWSSSVAWVHQALLRGFDFNNPRGLLSGLTH